VLFAVWHADAAAIYFDESVENTTGQTFLRGCRIKDSSRAVTFKTIVSGWCSGRIIHIHVMIRTRSSSGSVLTEFTTKLFFDSDAEQRADRFGFARQIARPAGHQQRGGQRSIPARCSRRCQRHLPVAVMLVHNSRRANNLAALPDLAHA